MFAKIKDSLVSLKAKLRRTHRSATIWFNGLCASFVLAVPDLVHVLPTLSAYIPDNPVLRYAIVTVNIANILLRFKTVKSLAEK